MSRSRITDAQEILRRIENMSSDSSSSDIESDKADENYSQPVNDIVIQYDCLEAEATVSVSPQDVNPEVDGTVVEATVSVSPQDLNPEFDGTVAEATVSVSPQDLNPEVDETVEVILENRDLTSEGESENEDVTRRGRKRTRQPDKWLRNDRHRRRCSGQAYTTRKGRKVPAKTPKPCDCKKCRFKCSAHFSDETRTTMCKDYYSIGNVTAQKTFLLSMIEEKNVARPRKDKNDKGRSKSKSCVYFLPSDGSKIRVCQKFFTKTLCVSTQGIYDALEGKGESGIYVKKDKRKGRPAPNKASKEDVKLVHEHINSFPRIDPHYCRKDTTMQYLSPDLNVKVMYRLYLELCQEREISNPVKESKYRQIFVSDFRLRCFNPQKDQCTLCNAFERATGNEKEEMRTKYVEHKEREEEALTEKASDKDKAKTDSSFHAVSFDLQAVLTTPFAGDSQIYYKRKLSVFNFTIYNSCTTEGHCYVWDETEGGRGANEISSALLSYINNLPKNVKHFSSFSDTCAAQNRNQFIAGAMLFAVQKTGLDTIDLKYMESGHSYLEVDSIHATIDCAKKHQQIYTTGEWSVLIRGARKKKPYLIVNVLKHSNFCNIKEMASRLVHNRTRNTEVEDVNWLQIKWLRFEKANPRMIKYKYRISDPTFKEIVVAHDRNRRSHETDLNLNSLYEARIPIGDAKKRDLLSLVKSRVIPPEYTAFYEDLPSIK